MNFKSIFSLPFYVFILGLILYIFTNDDKKNDLLKNKQLSSLTSQEKIEHLKSEIFQKEKIISRKLSIFHQANDILNKNKGKWSVIFDLDNERSKSINLNGFVKDENSKKQILALISQIPEIYIIRENITINPSRLLDNYPNESLPYDSEKDIIREDVQIFSTTMLDYPKEYLEDTIESNKRIKEHLDNALFYDPLVYSEIFDIDTYVSDSIPEVSGLVSSNAYKERVENILKDMKNKKLIYTYINDVKVMNAASLSEEIPK